MPHRVTFPFLLCEKVVKENAMLFYAKHALAPKYYSPLQPVALILLALYAMKYMSR